MTTYQILTLLLAALAAVISTISLVRSRQTQTKQLEFQAVTAALAKKQLELLERQDGLEKQNGSENTSLEEKARVTAELVKVGKADYRFVVLNQGRAIATDVTFEIDPASTDNPLVGNECQRKLPFPSLQPGQSFTLIAALHISSAMSYDTHLKWKNPDGSQGVNDMHLST
jgi:hypothetical protein